MVKTRRQSASMDGTPDTPSIEPKPPTKAARTSRAIRKTDLLTKPVRKGQDESKIVRRALGPAPLYAPPPAWKAPDPPIVQEDLVETIRKRKRGQEPTVWQLNPITGDTLFSVRHDTGVRRAHLRRLLDIAHLSLERGDIPRARRAWAILSRCAETQAWWTDGLIRDLVDAPLGSVARKELINSGLSSKIDRLRLAVLDYLATGDTRTALDELEFHILTDPYRTDAVLHFYAGCCALLLAQSPPRAASSSDSDSEDATDEKDPRLPNLNPTLAADARGYFRRAATLERESATLIAKEAEELLDAGADEDSLPSYPITRIEEFAKRYLILIDGHADALDEAATQRSTAPREEGSDDSESDD